ncbi:hypothetical protein D3C85_1738930 [compost metagenome]
MATDTLESMGQKIALGNNFYLALGVESEAEADRIFKELSPGGKIEMPMEKMFWGDYFGIVQDKFGTQWMITYTYPQEK